MYIDVKEGVEKEKKNIYIYYIYLIVYILNIYISILGVVFAVPFLCYFQKLQLLVVNFGKF